MKLWGIVDGEPWMMNPGKKQTRKRRRRARKNPALALYGNPEGKMARRRNKKGRFTKRARSHTRARRKTYRVRTVAHRARRRRRSYRRNPPALFRRASGLIPPINRIGWGMAGAASTRLVPGLAAKYLPQVPTTGTTGLIVKGIAAVLSGMLVSRFAGKSAGDDVTLGGLIVVADEAARTYVYPSLPPPLAAYLDPDMSAYLEPGMDAYISPAAGQGLLPDQLAGWGPVNMRDDGASRLDTGGRLG